MVSRSKKDWHERLGEALWAYRTTHRTPTQATPYSLVYGVEAVLLLEKQIPSLRIAIQEGLTTEDNARLRLEELEALDERRLEAQQRLECYQARLSRALSSPIGLCVNAARLKKHNNYTLHSFWILRQQLSNCASIPVTREVPSQRQDSSYSHPIHYRVLLS